MGARKKTAARKSSAKRPVAGAKATARKGTKKAGGRKKGGLKAPSRRPTPTEELAKRIVAAMDDEFNIDLGKLYTEDAVSEEPAGGTVTGLQSLRSKLAGWLAGLRTASWKARHVFVSGKTIAIEWEADITFKDGRQMKLVEIAIHEVRGDKIFAERYYYDPRALMPPAQAAPPPRPVQRPAPKLPATRHASPDEEDDDDEGSSVDPMDL
ncbi:MAG TPA: nuclear transport factor 2 family protein [Myxococcota bacterium]|nr:nuclear transport factor 2 family protein [Myxococcota bacterium]